MTRALLVPFVMLALLGGLFAAPVVADDTVAPRALVATTTTLSGPAKFSGVDSPLLVTVTAADSTPVSGGAVTVERRVGGVWRPIAEVVTNAEGQVRVPATLSRRIYDNTFRAAYAGDATYAASTSPARRIELLRRESRLGLAAPSKVVDERLATFSVLWRSRSGLPVKGVVWIQRRKDGRWVTAKKVSTSAQGRATWSYKVRDDSRWRAVGVRQSWIKIGLSAVRTINNVPPGVAVGLPAAAPRPRIKLPAQPRATKPGAAVVITPIPNAVWASMVGRSWHRGCPVGRAGLRLIRVNYWAYDGYRRRGEMVVNARVAGNVAAALKAMYDGRHPIRAMYRVDRFGWSSRLQGADDYKSMAAGNTSAFNCRSVVNRPGVRSPHSWGTAVDVNTWENPYRSRTGLVPNTWWHYHPHARVSWRSSSHPVVRLMRRHGLYWTYGTGDSQHFDARAGSARLRIAPPCTGECH